MQTHTAPVDTTYLPADEALFLGASLAHVSAYYGGSLSAPAVTIVPIREAYGVDYYVYCGDTLVRVCPSMGMAQEVAAGAGA